MLNALLKRFKLKLVKIEDDVIDFSSMQDTFHKEDLPEETEEELADEETVTERIYKLTIYLRNGQTIVEVVRSSMDDLRFPYADFYKWFFSKTTPYFSSQSTTGGTTFIRKDIYRFDVRKKVETRLKSDESWKNY